MVAKVKSWDEYNRKQREAMEKSFAQAKKEKKPEMSDAEFEKRFVGKRTPVKKTKK